MNVSNNINHLRWIKFIKIFKYLSFLCIYIENVCSVLSSLHETDILFEKELSMFQFVVLMSFPCQLLKLHFMKDRAKVYNSIELFR
jgi:hypothetical protein